MVKKVKNIKKTCIYGIKVISEDKYYYIGQSGNIETRFETHRKAIKGKKHKVKALNTIDISDIEMKVICEVDTDNSLMVMLVESLFNSILKPKNKIIWQAGRNIVSFARIPSDLAITLLNTVIGYYGGDVNIDLK